MASNDFHPDLRRVARVTPRQIVGPSTHKMMRALVRVGWLGTPRGVELATTDTGVRVRLYRPSGSTVAGPALLWIHGGGLVLGRARQDDALCRRFATTLGITVASVDYRLPPEWPFPAPLEDCYGALSWLVNQPDVDSARVAIGGASAGGGLTAALALLSRDRGEFAPAMQLLVYPMLDDRTSSRSDLDNRQFRLWNQRANQFGWASYLGDADPATAVPARRDDLSGLAPAWIGVGTRDLFHDEVLAYANRLSGAGVPCQLEVVPGAFHAFDWVSPKAPVSQSFFAAQCASLRGALKAES